MLLAEIHPPQSPSSRGRGLKLIFTHLWTVRLTSPSSRGRGLKCNLYDTSELVDESRPLHEGVDWNSFIADIIGRFIRRPLHEGVDWNRKRANSHSSRCYVALFTRAWIEIELCSVRAQSRKCRPLHEGVDWNYLLHLLRLSLVGRPLHEGVDWNTTYRHSNHDLFGRPLHEGVDWNIKKGMQHCHRRGRPLHEGVDWNFNVTWKSNRLNRSPSSRGRGLKLRS